MERIFYINTPDLDTIVTGFLLGYTDEKISIVRNTADEAVLSDRNSICIECGGSGRTDEMNFDHHDGNAVSLCAAVQAWISTGRPEQYRHLVEYTECIDTGKYLFREHSDDVVSLSELISGMRYTVHAYAGQFREGIRILRCLERYDFPLDDVSFLGDYDAEIHDYIETKQEEYHALQHEKSFIETYMISGMKICLLESKLYGVHGLLYAQGADISVAGNGEKWSISVRNPEYRKVLSSFRTLISSCETGWGGPVDGTILGSPRNQKTCVDKTTLLRVLEKAVRMTAR